MSDDAQPPSRRRPRIAPTLAVFAAVVTAMLPLTTLLLPSWLTPAILVTAAVLLAAYGGRLVRPGLAVVAGLLAWAVATALSYPGPVIGGLVPGPEGWGLPRFLGSAVDEVVNGIAPLAVQPPLAFVLISAFALFALVIDQIAIAARLPILAVLPLALLFIVPQLAVPRGDHVFLAIPFVVACLALIASGTHGGSLARRWQRGSAAGATGAVAVLATVAGLAIAPLVPVSPVADAGMFARPTSIDVSLDLGDDLRNAGGTEVMRVRTNGGYAPYLRLATHTRFDEQGWHVDVGRRTPLADGFPALEPSGAVGEVEMTETRTWITDVELDAAYLPLVPDAVAVSGASDGWQALENRTAQSGTRVDVSSFGEEYGIDAYDVSPTREQAERSPWADDAALGEQVPTTALEIPRSVTNGAIGRMAREVTSGSGGPYESLLALQDWLRSDRFSYSLETPVDDGFDGSDIAAVEQFLEVREGYCVHFAAAFTMMARSLDVPTRIAIGYLPGTPTGVRIDDQMVFSVDSGQLHAWPEAYLVGIGWTAFDPTPGVASSQGVIAEEGATATPTDSPGATAQPSDAPDAVATPSTAPTDSATEEDAPGSSTDSGAGSAWFAVAVAVGALLLLPALIRQTLRVRRLSAARRGDVMRAWQELRAIAFDADVPVHESESPRALGTRLVARGAPDPDVERLVSAVEHWSFAARPAPDDDLTGPLRTVARSLRSDAAPARVRRFLLPRSLWARAASGDVPAS
ncbi:DUF3488 and transglutaminase-like domain-containing protein [Microbacterium sp. G2-8]|uniref:transglutaminase family protein n=1 Tax=Microbacterium sp. G2-8 TaxID=2842454 RepID=UPI001C8A0DC9|nr:DUF3488 and transglutaminase-like domain-containing protein [Microbacterium sp. G2-8]